MREPIRLVVAVVVLTAAAAASAQYAAPGTRPAAPAAPVQPAAQSPVVPPAPSIYGQQPSPARSTSAAQARQPSKTAAKAAAAAPAIRLAPLCFEPMNRQDAALARALYDNGLLCTNTTGKGDPLRLRVTPSGDLTTETGQPTVWHRFR